MKNEALNLLGNENGKNRKFVMDKVLHPVIFRSELHECQKTTSQKHLGEVAVNLRNFRTNYKKISLAIKLNIKKVLIILEIFFLKKSPIVNLLVMVRMLSKHQGSHARAY